MGTCAASMAPNTSRHIRSRSWRRPTADQEPGARRGLFGVFKRKKETPQPIVSGCDPDLFADEISRLSSAPPEKKAEGVAALQSRVDQLEVPGSSNRQPEAPAETTRPQEVETPEHASDTGAASSWSSPFEWRKSPESRVSSSESESHVSSPESHVPSPEASVSSPSPSPESRGLRPEFRVGCLES